MSKLISIKRIAAMSSWLVMMLAILMTSAAGGLGRPAPIGTQCPTAPVQSVSFHYTMRMPDGSKMDMIGHRNVRPGDPGFKQCHCEQKASASQSAVATFAIVLAPPPSFCALGHVPLPTAPHSLFAPVPATELGFSANQLRPPCLA